MKQKTMSWMFVLVALCVLHSAIAEEIVNSDDIVLEGRTVIDVASGVTKIYSGTISGTGPIDKTGPGRLVLSGKNTFTSSTVDGKSMGVRINAGVIEVAGEGALGVGKLWIWRDSAESKLSVQFTKRDAVVPNSFETRYSTSNATGGDPHLKVVENTTFTGSIYSLCNTFYFGNKNWGMNSYDAAYPTNIVEGSFSTLDSTSARGVYLSTYGVIIFRGPITIPATMTVGAGVGHVGTLVLDTDRYKVRTTALRNGNVLCKRENVLNGTRLQLAPKKNDPDRPSLDMGGFNQTIQYFSANDYADGYASATGVGYEIKSTDGPATLTVTGLPSSASCNCYFAINDNVSLLLDAHPGYTCNFIKRENGTAGEIIVSNGTFAVTGTATFKNVPKITVAENGVFDLLSSKENALAGVRGLEIEGEFRSSSKTPFGDGNVSISLADGAVFRSTSGTRIANGEVSLTIGKGALVDVGTKIEVSSLTIDGKPLGVGIYAHDKYEEIAKDTIIVVPAVKGSSAVWTGAGEDRNITTELNWDGSVCPNLSDGSTECTFAAGGELAYIDRLVKFYSLKFAGNGFSFEKTSPEADAGIEILGSSITFEPVDGNPERTFGLGVPVTVAEKQHWNIPANTTVKLKDGFYSAQSVFKGGNGNLDFSGTNVFDGALAITNGTARFSGMITTSAGVDGSAYSANNAILCYNNFKTETEGKVILDNVVIEKPFCAVAPRTEAKAKQYFQTTPNSSNVIRGVWRTQERIWQTLMLGVNSTVVFEGGIQNYTHARILGGTVHIRNKPHFYTYDGGDNGDKGLVLGDGVKVFYEVAGSKLNLFNPGSCTVNYMVSYAMTGGYVYNGSSSATFNLNATTQRFDRVTLVSGMKINGNEGSAIEVAGSKESRIAAKVNGDVSFLNYGTGTLTFEGTGYAQTGDIVATNGTVVIADGARWKSLGNLTASGGARVKIVRTADSLKEQAFGRKTLVHLTENSVLEIPDGSVQYVKYLYIDGVRMDSGDYSFETIADANVKKHFAETTGVLRCVGDGMSIVVR